MRTLLVRNVHHALTPEGISVHAQPLPPSRTPGPGGLSGPECFGCAGPGSRSCFSTRARHSRHGSFAGADCGAAFGSGPERSGPPGAAGIGGAARAGAGPPGTCRAGHVHGAAGAGPVAGRHRAGGGDRGQPGHGAARPRCGGLGCCCCGRGPGRGARAGAGRAGAADGAHRLVHHRPVWHGHAAGLEPARDATVRQRHHAPAHGRPRPDPAGRCGRADRRAGGEPGRQCGVGLIAHLLARL